MTDMTRHHGACTFYSALENEDPRDGICTCGYGFQELSEGRSGEHIYSKEREHKLWVENGSPTEEETRQATSKLLDSLGIEKST